MSQIEQELRDQLTTLGAELARRAAGSERTNRYYDGDAPLPEAVVRARVTKAYRTLMSMAQAPWASLVVDSVQDRLEVSGLRAPDGDDVVDRVWGVWQDNQMDAESKLAHNAALVDGRCFATVWPENGGPPQITLDAADAMVIQYAQGSRRHRIAALRQWVENDTTYANLYRPDGIYKFVGGGHSGSGWKRRDDLNEEWPLRNPYGVVPVVELAVNRRLKDSGMFGRARGEFEHCTGVIDRIHLLTFLGLVVALWMGFPLRGVIGDKIIRDDEGNPIAPFDADADAIFQLENPEAKLAEYKAADRSNLSVYDELDQLATITKTPRHYFPMQSGMANLSADAIRASEGGLHAKVHGHKSSLGEGWEEVLRLGGLMLEEQPILLSQRAEIQWADHESRSLAERADAASKLKDLMPWQAVAEVALKASQDQIARWESMRTSDVLSTLLDGVRQNPGTSEPVEPADLAA